LFAFQWATHRDERFFERPNDFVPERWEEGAMLALPKYAYFPFGGGPRVCIGNTFAMFEAPLILAMIVARFRVERASKEPVGVLPAVTLRPAAAIPLGVTLRD
jgi:cytochrome P450